MEIKKKRKANRTSFKPGQVTNPKGRGATLPILKIFKEYTTKTVAEMYTDLMNYTEPELELIIVSPTSPALRKIIAQALVRDIRNREMDYSERVLNRIIGPVPARQEVSGANGMALVPPQINIIEALPAGQEPTNP